MHQDGRRALRFGTLAAACAVAILATQATAPVHSPIATPIAVAPADPGAARVVHGPMHSVPAQDRSPVAALSSSRAPCILAGVVRGADGAPVVGAEVWLHALAERARDPEVDEPFADTRGGAFFVRSDDEGSFELSTDPGDYWLYARDRSHGSSPVEPISLAPGEEVRGLELSLTGAILSGLVVDQHGDPTMARIDVRIVGHGRLPTARFTDQEGAFDWPGLPDAPLIVTAISLLDGARVERTLARPEPELILRVGAPLGEVTFQVRDARGQPVPQASLHVRRGAFGGDDLELTCDDGGEVTWQPTDPRLVVHATTDDLSSDEVTITLDASPRTIRIVLLSRATVDGRIVDSDGVPVSGHATLDRLDATGATVSSDRSSLGEDGDYGFPRLEAGRYLLRYAIAEEELVVAGAELSFSLGAQEARHLGDLRLPRSRRISGVVLDPDGEPAAHAAIDLVAAGEDVFSSLRLESDDEGRFEVERVVGAVHLRAVGDDGLVSDVVAANGSGDETLSMSLRATGSIDGLLRAPGDARVRCEGGLWHEVDRFGQYHIPCAVDASLEIEVEGVVRRYPVEVEENEPTRVALRW